MTHKGWYLLSWFVILGAAIVSSAALAKAQASLSPNESSSFQLAAVDGPGSASAIPAQADSARFGLRTDDNPSAGGWKKRATSNWSAEVGGGFNAPVGNDNPFITWGGHFNVGGGMHLNKYISLLAQYQFMDDKLPGGLIADADAQGGHAHIWSLTLNPIIDFAPKRINSIYVTGGGGFYRKVTSFTDPEEVYECDYFCYTGVENVVVSHFSSNQGGVNLGFGITHRLGGSYNDSKTKIFAEARYLWLDTPAIGEPNGLGTTGLIPVTVGLRW
jgi:hypothetical protein